MEKVRNPLLVETLPRNELEEMQNKLVRSTVKMAYNNSKFIHEKLDSIKMKPEDIKGREDLIKAAEQGFIIKDEDMLFNYGKLCSDYLEQLGYILLTTSGTSGKGWKQVPYTNYDIKRSNEQCELLFNDIGVEKGSKNLNAMGPPPNASGLLVIEGLKYIGASQFPLMVEVPPEVELKIIKLYRPEYMWKLGSKALKLGNEIQKLGEDPAKLGIKMIGIGGEPFSKTLKEKLSKLWNAKVTNIYASAEASVFAFECNLGDGMHVCENRILLTTVNPDTYEESEEGQILATMLNKENEFPGMYLINKLMNDASKKLGTYCECGRRTLKISEPERIDEMFAIESKKFIPRAIEQLLYDDSFNGEYVVVKYTDKNTGECKKLEIRAEVRKTPPSRDFVSESVYAFAKSNPVSYDVLSRLEKERKIEFSFKPEGKLYEGLEKYLRRGKPLRFIEVLLNG